MSALSGVTIYITSDSCWAAEPVIGELHVLDDDETTLHYGGNNNWFRSIDFWLLDVDGYTALEIAKKNNSTVNLTDWKGANNTVKIRELSIEPMTDVKRAPDYAVAQCSALLRRVS